MATIRRFEDLKVWQEARILCQEVFELIISKSTINDYKLKNQINGSSGSVMDNIAEGFERNGTKEFCQFLSIAKSSSGEVRSQLYRALDRNHITKQAFQRSYDRADTIGKMCMGLIKYLRNSDYSGSKFKVEEPESIYGNLD